MKPRLFIVDPQLFGYAGHHFEYCRSIADAARARGLEPVILAHRRMEEYAEADMWPVFRFGQSDGRSNIWRQDLAAALAEAQPGADDHIFLHTIYTHELEQFQALAVFNPELVRGHWHFLFRYDYNQGGDYDAFSLRKFFRWLGTQPALGAHCHFHTDSLPIKAQYDLVARLAGKTLSVLPVPQRPEMLEGCLKETAGQPLVVLYAGDARFEKGYPALPAAVEFVQNNLPAGQRVEFIFHSHFNITDGEAGVADARAKLQTMPGVTCKIGPFPPAEYYADLARADIALFPYDCRRYRRRTSGALCEALGAGKVCVVPARSWLADQMQDTRGVVFDGYAAFGPAVLKAIKNFEALHPRALKYAEEHRAKHNPAALVEGLLSPSVVHELKLRKRALIVCDEWVMDPFTGSNRVLEAELNALKNQGFAVHILSVLRPWTGMVPLDDLGLENRKEDFCARHNVTSLHHAWIDFSWVYAADYGLPRACAAISLRDYEDLQTRLQCRQGYVIDPAFLEMYKETAFDLIIAHRAHNVPIVEKIFEDHLNTTPVLCETHDAVAMAADADEAEYALEKAVLNKCQGVIAINSAEEDYFKTMLGPEKPIYHLVPPAPATLDPVLALAGCLNLPDILIAAGPLDEAVVPRFHAEYKNEYAIDVLMVSSDHPPTRASLAKFYAEVFVPFLKPRGVVLTLAGGLARPEEIPAGEKQIRFLGAFKNLDPLYAAAKMVLLPLYFGTGTAMKTIDALCRPRAVVAAPHAMRGFDPPLRAAAAALCTGDEKSFAQIILSLLESPAARQVRASYNQRFKNLLPCKENYEENFAEFLKQTMPGFKPAPVAGPRRFEAAPYIEADEGVQNFNIVMRKVLLGIPPEKPEVAKVREDFKIPARRMAYQAMFNEFFLKRVSPLAEALERTQFFSHAVRWDGKSFAAFEAALNEATHILPHDVVNFPVPLAAKTA